MIHHGDVGLAAALQRAWELMQRFVFCLIHVEYGGLESQAQYDRWRNSREAEVLHQLGSVLKDAPQSLPHPYRMIYTELDWVRFVAAPEWHVKHHRIFID